jgi:hypothetical protein
VDLEAPTVFGIDTLREISPNLDSLEQVLEDSFGIPVGTIPTADLQALAAQATFPLPPGVDLDLMPLAMPQFSLGLPMKTEVLLRYMPTYNVPDVGDINFLGLGVKHMVSQYIPACPVDISVQYVYQKLEVGDILSSTHTCLNVHASKKIPLLITSITPYVGLGIESSNLSVDYVITGSGNPLIDGTPIKFDIKGDNSFRPRVGFSTRILFFKVSADYAFGDYNVASLGVILSIR